MQHLCLPGAQVLSGPSLSASSGHSLGAGDQTQDEKTEFVFQQRPLHAVCSVPQFAKCPTELGPLTLQSPRSTGQCAWPTQGQQGLHTVGPVVPTCARTAQSLGLLPSVSLVGICAG